ncbi:Apyrase [Ancylostoma ceylanicum]|uniref:Apyrase n=1 Tax=Ancylostoma ceylanicum TaxID=53326 RepID=A0A0D6M3B1_9BILA|nr:Apyrase [Ancylostoma ceylanicum]
MSEVTRFNDLAVLVVPVQYSLTRALACSNLRIFWPYGTYIEFFPHFTWWHIFDNKGHHTENKITPRNITMTRHGNGSITYELLAITDMDKKAKVGAKNWTWQAVTRRGKLTLSADKKTVTVVWMKDSDKNITSGFNNKGRGMELSDLSEYNGHLLAPDDKTGMLYEIKDDKVTSKNWRSIYRRMRRAAGYPAPGYLTHEAVQWSSIQKMWYFLPRKASRTAYNETVDEKMGTNLLILAERSLKDFFVVHIGNKTHTERGFSAFDFIPGTKDKLMVALKTEEVHGQPTKSYFTVFSLNGTVLLPDQKLDDGYKFEGIYFV